MPTYSFVSAPLRAPDAAVEPASDFDGIPARSEGIVFNHSGNIGDVIYSLYFVYEFVVARNLSKPVFNIQIDCPADHYASHPSGAFLLDEAAAAFLRPLLDKYGRFASVTVSREVPRSALDLSRFRRLRLNFAAGDIRGYYYNLTGEHLPQDFARPLFVPEKDPRLRDRIILIRTGRYNNCFLDYGCLREIRDKLVFFGLPQEHEQFCGEFFQVEYFPVRDAAEAAELMGGARGVIGNPSGLYTIAECLNVPRVLLSPEFMRWGSGGVIAPGPVNVHPRGGWFEVVQTKDKFPHAVANLLALPPENA